MKRLCVLIPTYNAASVLHETLQSLEKQNYPITKVIIIDDYSADDSLRIANEYKKLSKYKVSIICHTSNWGWARSVNDVINHIDSELFVTLSDDCIILDKNGLSMLTTPFESDSQVVESCSKLTTSYATWKTYDFWLKCLFAYRVGKIFLGRNSSFCCFSTRAVKRVGLFDEKSFRTAGEDADIMKRLSSIGKIVDVDTLVEHIHSRNPNFSLKDLLYKQNQHAEAVGVLFSRQIKINFNFGVIHLFQILIRPMILIGLLIPEARITALLVLLFYSVYYMWPLFIHEWKNPRIFLLPFLNIVFFAYWNFYFLKGVLSGKQKL